MSARGLFPTFPFGTDLTDEEVVLKRALERLKWMATHKRPFKISVNQLAKLVIVPQSARPYLERMGLEAPRTLKERGLQRALVYALASIDAI